MHRQKIRLLRQLSESEFLRVLPSNALKLYLVLLVSAERIGREEYIEAQTIRGALGRNLTRRQLLRLGAALGRRGLATLRLCSRPPTSGIRQDAWCFRVLSRGSRGGSDGARKGRASRARRGR